MTNPLLQPWDGAFGLPPFAAIRDDDFEPAFDAALAGARREVEAIAVNPEAPDFGNTIEALDLAGAQLERVSRLFSLLVSTDSTPAREALQRRLAPRLAAHESAVLMDARLLERIETLWAGRDRLALTAEQARVLLLYRRMFRRAGAALDAAGRQRMAGIRERLAVLSTAFAQNLLADERGWMLPLSAADLEGLPDFLRAATRAAAQERGLEGHVLTLSRSLVEPFLQHSPRRDLRRRVHEAFAARGAGGGETDNRALVAEILRLREERARLLGYENFAAYKLEPEMARKPQAVRDLLGAVWEPARRRALADAELLTRMMRADGINGELEPWDWRYYAECRRRQEHALDEAAIKPHFALEAMIGAAFDCAHRLFGLDFTPLDLPLHHPDARAWEVTRGGRHMAVFIADHFARAAKRSGAWCSALRSQRRLGGDQRPIVLNVCNFARPAEGAPALLSWDEARTLFHEFGHALHHILSDVTYGLVSGTSVARDFVELPSQLFEHWLEVPDVLDTHARHVETGAAIPGPLRDRLLAAATHDQGFATVEYVASALVDLAFHERPAPADPMAVEAAVLAEIGMPHAIGMRHATPHFAHVFAGDGYASGYYSYMWSEVLDADAFEAFREAGNPFDPETARRLERHVLAAGGTAEPEALYLAFRGRMPGVGALLRGRGLAPAAEAAATEPDPA
ncbi:M3 family metallopeptidase [Albidovulum sp.]